MSGRAHALGRPLPPALRLVVMTTVDRWAPCAPRRCWGAVSGSALPPAPWGHPVPCLSTPLRQCLPWPGSAGPKGLPSVHSGLRKLPGDRTVPAVQRKGVVMAAARPGSWGHRVKASVSDLPNLVLSGNCGPLGHHPPLCHCVAEPQPTPPRPLLRPGVSFPLGSELAPQAVDPSDPGPPSLSAWVRVHTCLPSCPLLPG